MKRLARATALALFAAVALSGCIRYNVDMTLSEDNTASGMVVIAVQKGVGEQMDLASDQEALTQLFGESPFGPDFTPKEYADGDWVGESYTFDAVPITDLADLASLFTVTRDGDVFSVDGAGAPVTDDEQSQLPPGAESKLSITFPGDVVEHNGTLEGKTVTWDLFTMTDPVHATGSATGSSSSFPVWLLIAGGAALVALIGAAVVVILMRRRRGGTAPVNPAPFDDATPVPPSDAVVIAPVATDVTDSPAPPAPPAPPATPPAPPAPPAAAKSAAPRKPAATKSPVATPNTPTPTPNTPTPQTPPTPAPKVRAPRAAKPKEDLTSEGDGKE